MNRKRRTSHSAGVPRAVQWAGFILGIALGGLFDGILMHQILQWHHLLSMVDSVDSLSQQVFFDGLFHGAMYLLAATALWLFWRAREYPRVAGWTRMIRAMIFIGFGAWHLADALIAHWLLGIHRVKTDAPVPLTWDLLWAALFGVAPLALGWMLRPATVYGQGSRARTPG